MEPHDLLLSKLGAGRDKDLEFRARNAGNLGLVGRDELLRAPRGVRCPAPTTIAGKLLPRPRVVQVAGAPAGSTTAVPRRKE